MVGMAVWDPRKDDPGDEEFHYDDENDEEREQWYDQMVD
jgi:hypothetical protein